MAEVRDGVVYLTGQPGGALPGQAEFGSWDASVRTYDARGRLGFTLQYGSPGLDWANNIALGEDKVFVSGAAGGPMLGTVASGGFLDGYVLRLRVEDDD